MSLRLWLAAACLLAFLYGVHGQQPQSDNQKIFEEYRRWLTMQPVDVQRGAEVETKYRAHLRTTGLDEKAIEAQIQLVRTEGRRMEVERWNRILTAEKPSFNTAPNAFLVEMARGRKPGQALDVGMGQGRNAIFLAQHGWETTGFDPAERAVAAAQAAAHRLGVTLHTQMVGAEEFDFGENRWDLIVLSYVGAREITDKVVRSLRPGGVIVLEAFHRDATRGRSIGPGVVFDSGELPALFKNLRIVRYQEPLSVSDFGRERMRVVQLCAEKVPE